MHCGVHTYTFIPSFIHALSFRHPVLCKHTFSDECVHMHACTFACMHVDTLLLHTHALGVQCVGVEGEGECGVRGVEWSGVG